MERKLCKICKQSPVALAYHKRGRPYYRTECGVCYRKRLGKGTPWSVYKKATCEFCGFIPVNMCQLDVDHIDGDSKNNNPSNFQTLCSNCHRLKTFLHKDNIPKCYKLTI